MNVLHVAGPDTAKSCRPIECPAVCPPQLLPADDGRNGDTHVSQVGRRQTVKAFVGDHRQLEGRFAAVPEASGVDAALE